LLVEEALVDSFCVSESLIFVSVESFSFEESEIVVTDSSFSEVLSFEEF